MGDKVALIADDDEYFRMALQAILRAELGYGEVIEAGSFDEAVECLSERPDLSLVLFDLSMPGMDSPANLKTVRESFPHLLVAVVSASTRRDDILMALQACVHGYVPKSLGIKELPRALGLIVDGQIYVPPCLAELPPDADLVPANRSGASTGEHAIGELTQRQRQVLRLIVEGKSNKEIARALELGEGTVKIHVAALFRALGVTSRAAAAAAGAAALGSPS